jgi:hypothetical protein
MCKEGSRMRTADRFCLIILSVVLLFACPAAVHSEPPALRGFDAKLKYQYVYFGEYPTQADGTAEPVLWRVLGVQDGVAALMTEYIIDYLMFNDVKDNDNQNPLAYADTRIRQVINEQCAPRMFTEAERACLKEMEDGRGILSVPGVLELRDKSYGFQATNYTQDKRRQTQGTAWARAKGLAHFGGPNSWYWTTEWRKAGYRWIVGYDGHISTHGIDCEGGFRAVCYVWIDKVSVMEAAPDQIEGALRLEARRHD